MGASGSRSALTKEVDPLEPLLWQAGASAGARSWSSGGLQDCGCLPGRSDGARWGDSRHPCRSTGQAAEEGGHAPLHRARELLCTAAAVLHWSVPIVPVSDTTTVGWQAVRRLGQSLPTGLADAST
jgi:hypothetical protein